MRIFITLVFLCFAFQINYSQEKYTINGETLELKTEIEGQLDLLWNIIDGKYRYFVRTENGTIAELLNTKEANRTYLEEYKSTLGSLTNLSTDQLNLTTFSLRNFIDDYNKSVDSSYTSISKERSVQLRLGVSTGITNHPFVSNDDNKKVPLIAAELEFYEANELPRHSGFIQAKHTFEADDFNYSTTELSLGYRYKFINKSGYSIYGQMKLATLNFSSFTYNDENDIERKINDTAFDAPLIFGIGSDIRVGKNSYITLIYSELFAVFLDNQGNFSTEIAIGYKFNL